MRANNWSVREAASRSFRKDTHKNKRNTKMRCVYSFFFFSKRLKICVIIIAMMCGDVCRMRTLPRQQRFIALSALLTRAPLTNFIDQRNRIGVLKITMSMRSWFANWRDYKALSLFLSFSSTRSLISSSLSLRSSPEWTCYQRSRS